MTCLKRLNDVFPLAIIGTGIFNEMNSIRPLPFGDISAIIMDIEYFGNVSGGKIVSPLIDRIVEGDEITATERYTLANIIINMYYERWTKLYNTLSLEYNPIENYDMEEVMTDDETVHEYGKTEQRTDNLTHAKTGTETDTYNVSDTETNNLQETESPNLTNNTDNKIYAFNSENAVDTDKQIVTATGQTTNAKTGTVTNAKTGTVQTQHNTTDNDTGTQSTVHGGTDTDIRNYTLRRHGNIGVTTSQQMIQAERELWLWDFFHTVVFPDVDRVLTIPIY